MKLNLFGLGWGKRKIPQTDEKIQYLPLVESTKLLSKLEIENWRHGHQMAIDLTRPRTQLLMKVYDDALIDATLLAKMQTRILNALNTPFALFNANNQIDEPKTKIIQSSWFQKIIIGIMEEIFFGYTLLQIDFEKYKVKEIYTIPRQNVLPKQKMVITNLDSETAISFDTEAYRKLYFFFCENPDNLGLLLACSRWTIVKKNAISHWSQYQELFGIPFRYATTTSRDKKLLDAIENNLRDMGSAGYAQFPEGTNINFLEATKGDPYAVFKEFIDTANREITNAILGSAESTGQNGSYAREKVNKEIASDLNDADLRKITLYINNQVLPLLNEWDYDFKGLEFRFNTTWKIPTANNQLEVDKWLLENFEIDENYITETYGVPVKKKVSTNLKPDDKINITAYKEYDFKATNEPQPTYEIWMGNIKIFLNDMHAGKIKPEQLNEKLFFNKLKEYQKAMEEGTKTKWLELNFDTDNYKMYENMRQNLFGFSAVSTYAQLKEIQDLLYTNGKPVSFDIFKTRMQTYINQAKTINEKYQVEWLKTEYDFAINQSEANRRWYEFENNASIFPNLKYKTVGDDRVRDSHRLLNDIVRPIGDAFWDTYAPLNGWRCRCRLVATDEPTTDLPQELPGLAIGFNGNPAKKGVIFADTHPNFNIDKNIKEQVQKRTGELWNQYNAMVNKKIYNEFDRPKFEKVLFDDNTGGFIIKHKNAQTPDANEQAIIDLFVQKGYRVVLPEYIERFLEKNNDAEINGANVEFKTAEENKEEAFLRLLASANTQAKTLVLQIKGEFDKVFLLKALGDKFRSKDKSRILSLQNVIVKNNDKLIFLSRQDLESAEKTRNLIEQL